MPAARPSDPDSAANPTDTPALSWSANINTICGTSVESNKETTTDDDGALEPCAPPEPSQLPPWPPTSATRKPSAAIAVGLKALGFEPSVASISTLSPHQERIGRLDEQQLRQLDEKHQINSESWVAVPKRRRPCKGRAGATLPTVLDSEEQPNVNRKPVQTIAQPVVDRRAVKDSGQSVVIRKPVRACRERPDTQKTASEEVEPLSADTKNAVQELDERLVAKKNAVRDPEGPRAAAKQFPQLPLSLFPHIKPAKPAAMDTQKYRLPDHTNGNGTKVTLNTRREHLERNSRLPSPLDANPPPVPPKDSPLPSITSPRATSPPRATTPPRPLTPPLAEASPSAAISPKTASSDDYVPGLGSYFTPGHNRPGSIYTLSRASFANQLAQLTSLQLPDAESLASKISAIPTAQVATKALINAADQIRNWIAKAQEVIGGLDSDDDVEWSAAGGREGLEEVESAILRFEELINAYVGSIEELQGRNDITQVASENLKRAVSQMELIIDEWASIRATLHSVRAQVEIAMEWEELWNNVLGDIQGEMDELSRLVFEMEERRHRNVVAASSDNNVDIGDLETIVEDTPPPGSKMQSRFSLLPAVPMSPNSPGVSGLSQDDSSLLALFARMQPLRASLDFLPMRLSVFEQRAQKSFPTACEELEMRRDGLDGTYKKLEKDAESLRKELGEDRWVVVFRGAGRQAQKMQESVQRSLLKLSEAIDADMHLSSPQAALKKIESYEAKKMHYGPAIERVLSIIDRGVKDRLTVNGEILRLHADVQSRWESLKSQMRDMDVIVDDIQADRKSQPLRDSVSSMLSNDRSTIGSGRETPGSSPPSSVIMSNLGFEPRTPLPKAKAAAASGKGSTPQSSSRRYSSLPAPAAHLARKTGSRLSTIASSSATTPAPQAKTPRPASTIGHRPPWNVSTNASDIDTGHHHQPLSASTPSPYSKITPSTRRSVSAMTPSSHSRLPTVRGPAIQAPSESPQAGETPSRGGHSRLSFRDRISSPGPYSQQSLSKPRLTNQISMSTLTSKKRTSWRDSISDTTTEDGQLPRPASSLATPNRLTSMFKTSRSEEHTPGPNAAHRSALRKLTTTIGLEPKDSRPKWRP